MTKISYPVMLLMLAMFVALGPLATAMYLPAFPAMANAFQVGAGEIQLTLTAYMVGLSIAQLVCGPVADRWGRRPVLLAGLLLFALASLLCTLASSIPLLIAGRFLQAVGAAAGMVLARAIIRDTMAPVDATRALAHMGSTVAIAPAVGPIIGGLLAVHAGWWSIFLLLAICGVVSSAVAAVWIPETLRHEDRQALDARTIIGNYRLLLSHRVFLGFTLAASLIYCAHYAFLSNVSFVLIDLFKVPTQDFGWYYLLVLIAFISGNLLGARLTRRVALHKLIVTGGSLLAGGGLLMVILVLAGFARPAAIIGPELVISMGAGLMMPACVASALTPFGRLAGTASAMMGFLQMSMAALTSAVVGYLYDGTARPMAFAIAASGIGALLSYLLVIGRAQDVTPKTKQ